MLFLICKLYNYLKNNSLKNQNKRPFFFVEIHQANKIRNDCY